MLYIGSYVHKRSSSVTRTFFLVEDSKLEFKRLSFAGKKISVKTVT